MPIIIMQWRVEIGMSNPTHNTRFINEKLLRVVGLSSAFRLGIRYRWGSYDLPRTTRLG